MVAYGSGPHGWRVCGSFAAGAGGRLVRSQNGMVRGNHDVAIWGILRGCWELLEACRTAARPFWYLDHAFFRRGHQHRVYRVVRSDLWVPEGGLPGAGSMARWRQFAPHVTVEPWRPNGRTILVCPGSALITRLLKSEAWLPDTLAAVAAHSDRPVVVRTKTTKPSLAEQIIADDVHCVVADRSLVAVEAALLGVPVFVATGSAAAPVGLGDLGRLDDPWRPDRLPWLAALAQCQYSEAEMRSGAAWRALGQIWSR